MIADAIITIVNRNVMGSIVGQVARTRPRFQAPYLLEFVREFRRWLSGQDEVREYFIPDFSNWKNHDHFEAAFARLLKDLKASD